MAGYPNSEQTVYVNSGRRTTPAQLEAGSRHGNQGAAVISTEFFDFPLVMDVDPACQLCYVAAYLWTERYGTGGELPVGALGRLIDWSQTAIGPQEAARRLMAAGLMARSGDRYKLHDYRTGR